MIGIKRWTGRATTLTALTAAGALVFSGIAIADNISNSLDTSIDAVAEVMPLNVGGPSGSTTLYVSATGTGSSPEDGKSGCNLTGSTTLGLDLGSSNTAVATVSPASVTFTSCGDTKALTVTPVAAGSATITATQTSNNTGGTFNLAPVTFTVNVTAATPANTAPIVSVAGVTGGASYAKGSVPAATCSVTDTEDGSPSVPATLSAITGTYASDGIGSQTASCSYTDRGGLAASGSVTYSIIDPSAPGITYTLAPASPDGANGWYKTDVTLAWSVSEPQSPSSLAKTGCVDQSVTTDQFATTYSCSASSAGGPASQQDVTIKRDATAPTITATPSATANGAGYNNSSVDITYVCTEDTSGLAAPCPAADSATTDGTHVFAHTITDNAGNSSTVSTTVKLDATAPTIIGERTLANGAGWNNSDVTVTFTCADTAAEASGIKSCVADGTSPASNEKTLSADGADQSVSGTATDNADNTATATVSGINIDKSAPNAPTALLNPAPNGAGWNNSDFVVSFTSAGDNGPSGVDGCTADVPVNTETAGQTVSGTCTDKAGNESAARQVTVKLDKSGPSISNVVTVSGTAGTNGWYTSDVAVTFTATDNLSGPATATTTVSSSGEGNAVTVLSPAFSDDADNTTAAGAVSKSYKIDKTAPSTPTFNGGPGSSYYFGNDPAAPTCDASDAVSGLVSCEVTGGGSSVGAHSYTATATDNAGNQATASLTYTVLAWTTKGFYAPVDMGGVLNTVKGGSTVPLKFELFVGSTELTSVDAVQSFKTQKVSCSSGAGTEDAIELVTTGGTSLRYDTTGGQFIQNWKTPTGAGTCYSATMTADDGSTITALFKIK